MNTLTVNPAGTRRVGPASRGDAREIRNAGRAELARSEAVGDIDSLAGLAPDPVALDGGSGAPGRQGMMEPVTRHLGYPLTVANPVWGSNPIPGMRNLQKKLIAHSLASDQDSGACLQAITVVENAVRLRLRLQQMRMDDVQSQPEEQE